MTDASAAGSDIGGMFAAIDAQDSDAFVAYLAEDAVFRFGSAPPVQGRSAIRAAVDGFFGTIAGCAHRIDRTLRDGDTLVCVGQVTYRRHDGSHVTVPFTDVLDFDDGLIDFYGIYIDIAPLYAD
jgi:ketosteroid isomerase-like protein